MTSFPLKYISIQVLLTLILLLIDMNSNISLSIVLERTSNNSLSSDLDMDMNITSSRTSKILIRKLLRHIGKRASGLAGHSEGMLAVRTALVYKFSFLS